MAVPNATASDVPLRFVRPKFVGRADGAEGAALYPRRACGPLETCIRIRGIQKLRVMGTGLEPLDVTLTSLDAPIHDTYIHVFGRSRRRPGLNVH